MEHDAFLPHNQKDQNGQLDNKHQQRQQYGCVSDDSYGHHPHVVDGGGLSDDRAFVLPHGHGSIPSSPTSASLLYHGSSGAAHYQHQGLTPSISHSSYNQLTLDPQGHLGYSPASRAMSPPLTNMPVDPYRSALSQQQLHQHHLQQQQQQQQHPLQTSYSPYQAHLVSHGQSSPALMPYDDFSSSYDSRYSISNGSQPNQYPMYPLSPQTSNQALTASYHQQQTMHSPVQQLPLVDLSGERRPQSRQSMSRQLSPRSQQTGSKAASSSAGSRRLQSEEEEEEENAEILQRASQGGTRSGMTLASHRSGGKTSNKKFKLGSTSGSVKEKTNDDADIDDDEEEGQERGANRQRDSKRCGCCSRRLCVYMTFVIVICLAIAMYFLVPRSPAISFMSVAPDGDPVFSHGRMQESFTLQMRVDSSENYLPIKLTSIDMTVWYKLDQSKIGTNEGLSSAVTIRPRMVQTITLPMMFDYTSLKIDTNTDGTLQALISACTKDEPGSGKPTAPTLNLTFGGKMYVWGLSWIWKPQFSFNEGNVPCPINAKDPSTMIDAPPPASTPLPATTTSNSTLPTTTSGTPTNSHTASYSANRGGNSATPSPTPQ
ncbi:hypothetical protein BG004_002181 [Podila humilis]|nr:hypothetical protein BG004_002181 [Podila humilis]